MRRFRIGRRYAGLDSAATSETGQYERVSLGIVGAIAVGALVFVGCGDPVGDVESQDAEPEESVVITCTEGTTTVDLTSVAAAPDGVHVTIVDESGHDLLVRNEPAGGQDDGFTQVGAGTHVGAGAHVLQLAPGPYFVLCSEQDGPEHMLAPSESDESVTVEVTDPTESWVPGVLDCGSNQIASMVRDYAEGGVVATGAGASPADVIRDDDSIRLESGDVIEQAGYKKRSSAHTTAMRIVRDGRTVAVARMALRGEWRIEGMTACSDD